ncbi:MAG: PAS domain S-box protein [Spirochaetales bacterium]|nr:PAS domain S-box protein [Spirochaetales bacterium]
MKGDIKKTGFDIYRKAFEENDYALILTSSKGYIIDTNNSFDRLLGIGSWEEIVGRHFSKFIYSSSLSKSFTIAICKGENWRGRLKAIHTNGTIFDAYLTVSLIKDNNNEIVYGLGTIVKITEYQAAFYTKTEHRARFDFLTEKIHDGYWLVDSTGKIIDCNSSACKMLDYSKKELLGKNVFEIDKTKRTENINYYFERMIRGETIRFKSKHNKRNGESIDVDIIGAYRRSHKHFIGSIRNITPQEQLAEQIREMSQTIESLNESLQTLLNMKNVKIEKQENTTTSTIQKIVLPMIKQLSERCVSNKENQTNQLEIINTIKLCLESIQAIPSELSKKLSTTELKVSQFILQGYSSKEIGSIMNVSGRTVENYRQSIRKKLGIINTSKRLRDVLDEYYSESHN